MRVDRIAIGPTRWDLMIRCQSQPLLRHTPEVSPRWFPSSDSRQHKQQPHVRHQPPREICPKFDCNLLHLLTTCNVIERPGLERTDLVLGQHSGRAALADRAKALGYQLTLEQLRENIATADVQLSDELIAKINAIHHHSPNPAP